MVSQLLLDLEPLTHQNKTTDHVTDDCVALEILQCRVSASHLSVSVTMCIFVDAQTFFACLDTYLIQTYKATSIPHSLH